VYLATAFAADGDLGSEGKTFVTAYTDKYNESPDLPAALAFDAVRQVVEALERAKTWQASRLTSELAALDFASVSGPLTMSDRRAKRRIFIVAVAKTGSKVAATFGPGLE
jgi:ABC-type branched-subunit amino acid transport system substrate-binding protein